MKKIKLYFNFILYIFNLLIPKKKNRWVFGAWFGNKISDNPYALYMHIVEHYPQIDAVWICNESADTQQMNINVVRRNSFSAIWKCLTARVSIMNQCYLDFGDYNWISGSYKVQLWHGVPWKKIGEDIVDKNKSMFHKISHQTYLFFNRCDLYIAPSERTRLVMKTAFLTDDESIVPIGQPRNELLMDKVRCKIAKESLTQVVDGAEKIILYMPTFRDRGDKPFSFSSIGKTLDDILEKYNAIILEKQHYVVLQSIQKSFYQCHRVIDVANYDAQVLLASADILVTDYSSCFFDFLLRDKPIVHFLYDYEQYKDIDRGLYYAIEDATAGEVAFTEKDLLHILSDILSGNDNMSLRRAEIRNKFITYECKENSKVICDRIFKDLKM